MRFVSQITTLFLLLTSTIFVSGYRNILHNSISSSLFIHIKTRSNGESKKGGSAFSQEYTPIGANQISYVNFLNDPKASIVLGVGPAGTGKTLLACNYAVNQFVKGNIQKIILTRPVVSVDEDLGFLPGDINRKMDPYTRPLFDILQEYFSKKEIDSLIHTGSIEISPLAFMRGRTFKNAFIIADEMQNSSPNQMLMLSSRIGVGSRMVITGDLKQTDRGENNGLADFLKKIKNYNTWVSNKYDSIIVVDEMTRDIRLVEFNFSDIMRSSITSKVIDIYSNKYEILNLKNENDCALIPLQKPYSSL